MKYNTASALLSVTLVVCLGAKLRLQKKVESFSHKELALEVVNASYYGRSLRRYGMGFDNVLADLIWIDLLQRASHHKIEGEKVSWEYAQLEAITTLDPNFLRAYSFGASFLSVFRQDKVGAKLLLEKWVKRDPSNWHSHYVLGYHLYYEMRDFQAAFPHMLKAAELPGAPAWLSSLGIRILTESGALANALRISVELFDSLENNGEGRERLADQIRSLRFALEKKTLEEALESYRKVKGHEPAVLSDLHPFISEPMRQLASQPLVTDASERLQELLAERFPFYYDAENRRVASRKSEKELKLVMLGLHWNEPKKKKGK